MRENKDMEYRNTVENRNTWISRTKVREPSTITAMASPTEISEPETASLKNISEGFKTAWRPVFDISKTPSWEEK